MTHRERFHKTLECEAIGGQVPTMELVFFLTMEVFGKVHPAHRNYYQWNQMSYEEKKCHINDIADLQIAVAKRYDHSAILAYPTTGDMEAHKWLLEAIREKTGDEYSLLWQYDPTWEIPNGSNMMEFSIKMYEDPESLHDISKRRVDEALKFAEEINRTGHLLDGFAMCSDYCFNTNPFFSLDQFDEFIVPYLKAAISGYRELGYYTIKHTDGNIMPIVKKIAECKPNAIHSLDPQGGVDLTEVRKIVGDNIALIGNVNCGLLQTGTDEECRQDVLRSLKQGMEAGKGYVFATSNCVYTGMSVKRYELMWNLWKEYGNYDI